MRISLLLILLFNSFIASSLKAQNASFVMSSTGALATSSNTSAFQFQSVANCIDVQTGIAVLSGQRGTGQFAVNCQVTMNINTLGIKMYPNPVLTSSNVKFINTPPLTEIFNLAIWGLDGSLISSRKETGYNIFQGVLINLTALNAGTYVLKIESSNYVDAIKFIKAN